MYLCRHANGSVEDYVQEAIRLGLESLGMSDHAPFKELKDRSIRMAPEELGLYLSQCDKAIENYKGIIKIYKALEIEYFPKYDKMYEGYLDTLDYLALGQHYITDSESFEGLRSCYRLSTYEHITTYVDTIISAMKSKYFKFVCHPDLMLYNIMKMDEQIINESTRLIQAAVKYDIPLEINANGIRKGIKEIEGKKRYVYPRKEFWEIVKKYKAKVIVSSDAHDPSHLYNEEVIKAYEFARELGIEVEEALDI
jgi:histidinol-phosphatase (PHP family)